METPTKQIEIVYHHPDMAYSYLPYSPLVEKSEFKGNINEMKYDVAHDQDTAPLQGQDMPRFKVIEKILPAWMEVKFYISHYRKVDSIFHDFGMCDQPMFEKYMILMNMGIDTYNEIVKLLKTNLRSQFRISLKNQIQAWLDDPLPKFETPLSKNQAACLKPYKNYNRY